MTQESLFEPLSADYLEDPYPTYRRLLREAPLYRLPKGVLHTPASVEWLASKHEYVSMALKDKRFIRETQNLYPEQSVNPTIPAQLQAFFARMGSSMLFRDPPNHTRLRGLVNKAFTPVAVESLRPRITDISRHLLNQALELREFDLIREFALPLPVIVIGEMLGVPVTDRDLFKRWSLCITRTLDATVRDPAVFLAASEAYQELTDYLRDIIRERQVSPREDILTALIKVEEEGEKLNEEELLSTCVLLLVAGHETTTNLIGNGFWTLHRFPAAREQWRTQPALTESAVEEILRFESPVQRTIRYVSEPVRVGDAELSRGDAVSIVLGAANRDPDVFVDPDRFDITRSPNRHLAFAVGPHFCLGAPLARLEGQIALSMLIASDPKVCVVSKQPKWRALTSFRGLEELPVQVR